jgi:antitoxin ParD1/3/4
VTEGEEPNFLHTSQSPIPVRRPDHFPGIPRLYLSKAAIGVRRLPKRREGSTDVPLGRVNSVVRKSSKMCLGRSFMPDVRKVSVALTAEQISVLKAAVDAGEYATTSEIVREAIRDWQFKRELRQEDIDRMRRLWDEGKASGSPRTVDFEHVKRLGRARVAGLGSARSHGR